MSNVNDFVPFCPTDTGTNLRGSRQRILPAGIHRELTETSRALRAQPSTTKHFVKRLTSARSLRSSFQTKLQLTF